MNPLRLVLQVCLVLVSLAAPPLAKADSWRYPPTVESETISHGNVRIVLTTDARLNQKYPDFVLEVFNGDKHVARIPGVSFDRLFPSPDNTLFVGLSNSGLPGTAAIVFTDQGRVTLLAQHGLAEFEYCSKSVTLNRVWFDAERPDVRFRLGANETKAGIFLRDCKGQDIELVETVQSAYAKARKSAR